MVAPKIIRFDEAETHGLHGEGRLKKLVYPQNTGSAAVFVGMAIVPPGEAPHVFHEHGVERIGDIELAYADDFEEFYFVIEGEGHMEWIDDTGAIHRARVKANDSVFMPPGADQHRIFNSGKGLMRVLYGGSPPATVRQLTEPRGR